ncbi:MAG: hypothetical protein COT73_06400 [Bdellovibrio sp. CG10_big_fil_rev_8_21_14_0_10_47_8]|nr:MAG: hypothetical protein COT73_06400 [Bdellovibrio sp. CG10_big_fil_rev_8_21_14_0_10_47_8]
MKKFATPLKVIFIGGLFLFGVATSFLWIPLVPFLIPLAGALAIAYTVSQWIFSEKISFGQTTHPTSSPILFQTPLLSLVPQPDIQGNKGPWASSQSSPRPAGVGSSSQPISLKTKRKDLPPPNFTRPAVH